MQIAYDGKSFLIDGRRVWMISGEIHYFRHPREEWREVLLRAKRAGLNTVSTYVPWNFHEVTEGTVDFEGDKDLGAFINLIGEMGMYAMLRPGPYICSEWDGGGLPAWLCAKPVRRLREDDAVYMAAVESWFDRLIPIISERQITKGGPVVTVQNENEYPGGWNSSMRRYIRKLTTILRKHGIEVPLLACNVHGASETTVKINDATEVEDQLLDPELILTYNHHYVVEPVYDLKRKQPDAPLFTTEFWCGAPIYWGNRITDWPEYRLLARAAYEYTSAGTQVNYYMFEGGTNFGFWSGNNIATTYASGYPVGEGGKLTDKYYAVRPPNLFAAHFAEDLAESDEVPDREGVGCPGGVRLVVRRSGNGSFAFVSAADKRKEIPLTLADGRRLTVHLGEVAAAVLPVNLELFQGLVKVDYSNLCLLAKEDTGKVIILYGQAGTEGVVSLNGTELQITVGRRKIAYKQAAGVTVVVADEEMARRCWIVDGHFVFGPDYAAEWNDDGTLDIRVSDETPEVVYLDALGRPIAKALRLEPDPCDPPELGPWRMTPCGEVLPDGQPGWTALLKPCSHEALGIVHGYVWYGAELECEEDGVEKLLLSNTPNRVTVFLNGQYCGTHADRRTFLMRDEYEHPADWFFEELTVRVKKGINRFVFLSDDSGHNYDVPISNGIQGPVFLGSRLIEVNSFSELPPTSISDDAFYFMHNRHYREPEPLPALEFELDLKLGEQAIVSIHGVHAWITVGGVDVLPLTYPESPWTMFSAIKRWIAWQLPQQPAGERVKVRVQYEGCLPAAVKENMMVYIVPNSGELTNWQWKLWEEKPKTASSFIDNDTNASEKDGIIVLLPNGGRIKRKGRMLVPAYLETRFPMPDGDRPVYLRIGEMKKGQIFLNGHNAGRFRAAGETQDLFYLPRSWMREENELIVFEELGLNPQYVSLEFGGNENWSKSSLHPKK